MGSSIMITAMHAMVGQTITFHLLGQAVVCAPDDSLWQLALLPVGRHEASSSGYAAYIHACYCMQGSPGDQHMLLLCT